MSRKHDLGYERKRRPVMRDDPPEVRLAAEIHNLNLRIDALDEQMRAVEKARNNCLNRLISKEQKLEQMRMEQNHA